MYFVINDGQCVFPLYIVAITDPGGMDLTHIPFKPDPDTGSFIIYFDDDLTYLKTLLDAGQVVYQVSDYAPDPAIVSKAQGVVFQNWSECYGYLVDNITPQRLVTSQRDQLIQQLQANIEALQKQVNGS